MALETTGKLIIALAGLASAFGGSFVLITFALFEELISLNFGYLIIMTISDTLFGLMYFFISVHLPSDNSWECSLSGTLTYFFNLD